MAKRNLKNKRIRLAAIVAALSTGGTVIAMLPSANADQKAPPPAAKSADPDAGHRHFIHIATHGAPLWTAEAWLMDGQGHSVYRWREANKSGDYALWYFTNGGDGGKVRVTIKSDGGDLTDVYPLDRDHCFLVDALGDSRYTGDNVTGGCTPD